MNGFLSMLNAAISSGNLTAAATAAGNITGMFKNKTDLQRQVGMLTLQYELNQPQSGGAPTPQQSMNMTEVCQSLVALIPQLPAADAALVQELGTPAIEANPAAATDVIGRIQASIV